jgi:predicted MPP superfamily phosphohydrolase
MIWLISFALAIILCIAGVIYLISAIGRFGLFQRIEKKWLRNLLVLCTIACGFIIITVTLSFINALTVLLHVLIFFLLSGLIFKIISLGKTKNFRFYYQGWLAIITSVIYLGTAYYLCVHVWETDYSLSTDKDIAPVKIALIADSHLSTTFDGAGFAKHIEEIDSKNPDLLVISGDFVDASTKKEDLAVACKALGNVKAKYGVWYAYGNHDVTNWGNLGVTKEELEAELSANNIHIMEDSYEYIGDLCIVGRKDAHVASDRADISDLLSDVDTTKYIVVLDHEPTDYDNEAASPADLVLSGHTHGGQLIPITYLGVWLGFNDSTYGYKRINNTDFIVTSGIADWEIFFKTGTRSEYVLISVNF